MLLGVSYKNGNLWYVQITIKGVHYHIGTSKIEEEAAQLFAKAHRKYKIEGKKVSRRAHSRLVIFLSPLME